tara:strand:- start:3229 stop:7236 length:4008 start_codon:yes stop_codon:yes gene_type:complete
MENETIDIDSMDAAQLKEYLGDDYQTELPDQVVPTDTPQASDIQQPSTEGEQTGGIRSMDQVYQDRMAAGRSPGRPGVKGFLQDTVEGTARNMYSSAAPIVGLSDTLIDAINFASAGDQFDIPKLPAYESKMHTAVRNISGLVIPSLGLRSMAIQGFSKLHAAGKAAPWLQRLGNTKSFSYFAKFGIDVGTGASVDYVAEQNQKDDNLFGVLKNYWPKTFQFIPNSIATNEDDSAGEKRAKNVNEGAIFSIFASIIEGVAYLTKAGRSVARTAKFIPSKEKGVANVNELAKDQFSDIKFSDNITEDAVLRNYARKENSLNELSEYYLSKGEQPPNWPELDEGDTLVRTRDPDGIIGAQADAAQIQNNIESGWGRLGTIISEAARKEGLEINNLTNRTLVSELTDQLKKSGKFRKTLRSGTVITERMIDKAGKHLAATLLHPRVDPDDILGILDEFKRSVDGSAVRIVGKKGINRAVKQLKAQMLDLDAQKARAYLVTSEAGQVADFSEGARLMEDGTSVMRTIDLMADRLEVLMVEKGLANFESGSMFAKMHAWQSAVDTGDASIMNAAAETILDSSTAKLTEIIPKAKEWTSTLKAVARENPQFLRPLLLANEFTDGNVDTLFKLHEWAADNLATFRKAAYDAKPEVPSIINKAMWSNIFNSALSAISTPMNAGVGNLTGLLGKGTATVTGAVLQGDLVKAKKAMVAHFALDDTLQKSFEHMRLVFRKASTNPKEVSYVMRGDIARETERGLETLRAWADAAEANGELGGKMLLKVYEDLDALSVDPVLRFGGNSMTALDGFSKSVIANTEAKYLAFNKLAQSGEEITEKNFRAAVDSIYNKMFDSNGMISDEAVDIATSEIALNADSPVVEGMNEFIKRFPAARTFIWFPRTTANVIDTFGKWSPAGILSSDYHKMWGPLGRKKISEFSMDEIKSILQSKGKKFDEFALDTFETLRYETKGKAAIGSLFVTAAGFAMANDRCTGNGHYDKSRQRMRVRSGWKPKSCKVPGTNKVVSYEWMGPIGDWLSLTIDVADNFDSLTTAVQEDLYNKLAFVLGSAVTNRSVLSQLEPMYDVLQGNGAAATRFLTNFGNNLVPLGSARNELGKILYPQLRQIRSELDDALRNRNAWLDAFDPERALPSVVDPIDGKEIGNEDNWFIRVWNRTPFKVHSQPSKESQFLIDIEFNSNPTMRLSQRGALLENHEVTAINSKMGEQGYYKNEIREIMKDAAKLTYTGPDGVTYKGFINIIQAQRRGLIPSDILDTAKFARIYSRITVAYAAAKRYAEDSLDEPMRSGIREREYEKINADYNQKAGDLDTLYEDSGLQETLNIAK